MLKPDKLLKFILALIVVLLMPYAAAGTLSNIDSVNKWAWNDLIGWIDFYANDTGANVKSIKIDRWGVINTTGTYMALHCSSLPPDSTNDCTPSFGVINDGSGNLSGYAWSDEYGWISFCGGSSTTNCPGTIAYGVTIDGGGNFQGFAWNDVIGWISFNCANHSCTYNYKVSTSFDPNAPPSTTNNYLESVTIDTESDTGFMINSIYWEGALVSGSIIGFQIAVATSTNFSAAEFVGSDGTVSTLYNATNPSGGEAIPVRSLYHRPFESGYRYFRYRVYMDKSAASPEVSKISINWSK